MKSLCSSAAASGLLSIILAALLWGTVGITAQYLYRISALTPVSIGFYRLLFAVPVTALLCWRRPAHGRRRPRLPLLLRIAFIGVMLAAYQVLYFSAVSLAGVTIATLITLCSAPLMVAGGAALWLQEKFTRRTALALLLALLGTLALTGLGKGSGSFDWRQLAGVLLALGSAAGYASVTLMSRLIAERSHPLDTAAISFSIGAVCLLPLAAANLIQVEYSPQIWWAVIYLGVIPTGLSYLLFFLGVRQVRASTAAVVTLLEPLTATLLATLLFGERLGPGGVVGALLLLAGLSVLFYGEKQR